MRSQTPKVISARIYIKGFSSLKCWGRKSLIPPGTLTLYSEITITRITSLLILEKSKKFDYERDLVGAQALPGAEGVQKKLENSRAVQPTKTKVEFKTRKKGEELLCLY